MSNKNRKSYRIRTAVGNEAPSSINVNLEQTFDVVDVLSLEIKQTNFYKMPSAGYGVIVGRVIANGGFGIPNAKVSVFIPYDRNLLKEDNGVLYNYTSTSSKDSNGVRYNLLPRHTDELCHQDVGTMYEKEYLLDNNDLIQVFDTYYKYTAVTNNGGDYFIYGVPVGTQTVHVDLDLSDIGVLSQRPRDMMYKGFNANQFENPNKFKKDTNLNSLSQIYTQDKVVTVYPFWGDTSADDTNGTITRCDIDIDYKFEPTCVFIGSIVSDTAQRSISQRCVPDDEIGKMSELVAGEGKIEMIRRTFDGKVEQFAIQGNNLIDGDGVWCYQIPMNLDYVMTNEFGEMVPTDDPSKGIPTRTRVRFRISMNETETDGTARKRARFLVPNNPKLNDDYPSFNKTHEADYEFGSSTKDESYRDMFWNKVYTVKSYIPRLQKAKSLNRRVHTGIKNVNHAGGNNPFPYNNLFVRLTFLYRFLCTLTTLYCTVIYWINYVLGEIGWALYNVAKSLVKLSHGSLNIISLGTLKQPLQKAAEYILKTVENITIELDNFCEDGNIGLSTYIPIPNKSHWKAIMTDPCYKIGYETIPPPGCIIENLETLPPWDPLVTQFYDLSLDEIDDGYKFPQKSSTNFSTNLGRLFNCIENQLAQDQECTSFNFGNDWVNGVLYAPLWYRKVRSKKRIFFGLIPRKSRDKWCDGSSSNGSMNHLALCQTCAPKRKVSGTKPSIEPLANSDINTISILGASEENCYGYKCHKKNVSFISLNNGLIISKETMFGEYVYYYKSVEYDDKYLLTQDGKKTGDIKTLFATDIVLLGSLNECDNEGIPQFFKNLEGTTYNMPPDLILMDYNSDSEKLKWENKNDENSTNQAFKELNIGDDGLSDIPDNIDESDAINLADIHTDKTGADWGNFGKDQITENYLNSLYISLNIPLNENDYLFTTKKELPDFGGLFYGLTCWSAYTKPKSCINLSRICEYGVSLDESQEFPDYSSDNSQGDYEYKTLSPDGFISYDELYDKDGRAMFATMNGNNLRTKLNPKNGFPIYDFMYLYPENFDGSLRTIMNRQDGSTPEPQANNYKLENSSESYMRFRYGRNKNEQDNEIVNFYHSKEPLGLYKGDLSINKNRFPKYENSFYFYFGLNEGNTAIDKFRTLYYSECEDGDGEHIVVSIDYKGNSWCSEIDNYGNPSTSTADGWISIDATYVDTPYKIRIESLANVEEVVDLLIEDIITPKVYFSKYNNQELEDDNYIMLTYISNNSVQHYGFLNGRYRITITNANGEEFSQIIDYNPPHISANISTAPFRIKNDDFIEYFDLSPSTDVKEFISRKGGNIGETMRNRNELGGFIKVTGINQDGNYDISFKIEVKPMFELNYTASIVSGTTSMLEQEPPTTRSVETSYHGSIMTYNQTNQSISNDDMTLMIENHGNYPPYCPYYYIDNPDTVVKYDFRFGVPCGDEKYKVTITEACIKGKDVVLTRNTIATTVTVPQPIDFKMFINGTDYELIKDFNSGWIVSEIPLLPVPVLGFTFNREIVEGWNDMNNIDGLTELQLLPEGTDLNDSNYQYANYIEKTDLILSNKQSYLNPPLNNPSKYTWSGSYVFDADVILTGIGTYQDVPSSYQDESNLIKVLNKQDGNYYFWIWNTTQNEYKPYSRNNSNATTPTIQQISLEEYYNNSGVEVRNSIIQTLNDYIIRRKNAVENAKNSFFMRTEEPFILRITSQTYETPVKTILYYCQDMEDTTSNNLYILDNEWEERTCYGITVPTFGHKLIEINTHYDEEEHVVNIYPSPTWEFLFGDYSDSTNMTYRNQIGEYTCQTAYNSSLDEFYGVEDLVAIIYKFGVVEKKPYFIGIKNAVEETKPDDLKSVINENNPIKIIPKLFMTHIINKKMELVYNSWTCMENWPFYYNKQLYGVPGGSVINPNDPMTNISSKYGSYNTLPGLFAGFIINGSPESYGDFHYDTHDATNQNKFYIETLFNQNNIDGVDFKIATLNVDENENVNEDRIPIVRVVYSENIDNEYYNNYSFDNTHGTQIGDNSRIDNIPSQYQGYRHLLLNSLNSQLIINDTFSNISLTFDYEVETPSVTYRYEPYVYYGELKERYVVTLYFNDKGYYTFYTDQPNPVYEKIADNDNNVCVFPAPDIYTNYNKDHPQQQINRMGSMNFNSLNFNVYYYYNAPFGISVEKDCLFETDENNVIINNPITTLFVVKMDKELQRRCISKTFELTPVEYRFYIQQTTNQRQILINLGNFNISDTSNLPDGPYMYFKDFPFSIDITDKSDGTIIEQIFCENGYKDKSLTTYDIITTHHQTVVVWFPLENIPLTVSQIQEMTEENVPYDVYITDVTGLRRKMRYEIKYTWSH